jgi:P-type conjugative transfer ATPase TrbB
MGETVTPDRPSVAGVLPRSGERFQGVLPPLADRPIFTIRKRATIVFTLDDYVAKGILSSDGAAMIRQAVIDRKNILVAGGTGSGKTTLVNAILAEPAFKSDRIVIIEDTKELQCPADDKVELLTKNTEPRVTMTDLLRMTLRLRPDRIILGEVRGGEALAMLKAWNTGHPGGVATIHANSAGDALHRVEDLVGESSYTVPKRSIASAINIIIHIERVNGRPGRRVSQIVEVTGCGDGEYLLREVRESGLQSFQ